MTDYKKRRTRLLKRRLIQAYVVVVTPVLGLGWLFIYAVLHFLRWESEAASSGLLPTAFVCTAILIIPVFFCVFARIVNPSAVLGPVISTVVAMSVGLAASEWLLPSRFPIPVTLSQANSPFDEVQKNLQRLLRRRNTARSYDFRGETHVEAFGSSGWPGPHVSDDRAQILFVGDSFLEVRSRENLAALVATELEDRLPNTIQVANLSEAATSPVDYRFRVHELIADYNPHVVVVFVYAMNDLLGSYADYQHPEYFVTRSVLDLLETDQSIDSLTLRALKLLHDTNRPLLSKDHLLAALPENVRTNQPSAELVYLSTLAFSLSPDDRDPSLGWLPSTVTRLTSLLSTTGWFEPTHKQGWQRLHADFVDSFSLAEDKQMSRVAELAASYSESEDKAAFFDAMQEAGPEWWDVVSERPDVTYFLWPALHKKVTGVPRYRGPNGKRVAQLTTSTYRYLRDMVDYCKRIGIPIAFVMIPEASQVDEEFYQFWRPMIDFRKWQATTHEATSVLSSDLVQIAPTLDLSVVEGRLNGAYWLLDGHWNQKGNVVVSELVADFLVNSKLLEASSAREEATD